MTFYIFGMFRKSVEKIQVSLKYDDIRGLLHYDEYTVLKISRSFLLRTRNVPDRSCTENQNTHFVFNNFFSPNNRAVYEIKWKNTVELHRPQMKIWRMRVACCIPKAINTHSEYVIIIPFTLQQWLHERASMSCFTSCLVAWSFITEVFWLDTTD